MSHPFTYVGCFVKREEFQSAIRHVRKNPLENDIPNPHVTFAYRPEEVVQSLFGEIIHITIVGYGNNGINEGLKVQLKTDNPALQIMIGQIEVPHITIAVSKDGKPVNTRSISFDDIDPIELEGKYGGYTQWGEVVVKELWEPSCLYPT